MPSAGLLCSFCGKSKDDVESLIAGPGVYICDECVDLCVEALSGRKTSSFPPLDGKTDEELLADLARIDDARDQAEAAVRQRVGLLRGRAVTWARIGESLGISRQSAWERFAGEE